MAVIGDDTYRRRQLQEMVDDTYRRRHLQEMVDQMNLTEDNAYEEFARFVMRYFVVYTYQSTLGNDIPNQE